MKFMERLDTEILLGQISYKQKADMYNYYFKYEKTAKQCRYLEGIQQDAISEEMQDEDRLVLDML